MSVNEATDGRCLNPDKCEAIVIGIIARLRSEAQTNVVTKELMK